MPYLDLPEDGSFAVIIIDKKRRVVVCSRETHASEFDIPTDAKSVRLLKLTGHNCLIDWSGVVLPKLTLISINNSFSSVNVEDIIGSKALRSCNMRIIVGERFTMPPNYYTKGAVSIYISQEGDYDLYRKDGMLVFDAVAQLDLTEAREDRIVVYDRFSYVKSPDMFSFAWVHESISGAISIHDSSKFWEEGLSSPDITYANHDEFESAEGQSLATLLHIKRQKSANK